MELSKARTIAQKWQEIFQPVCDRIEIAGSIRREKPEVKDIELICVPLQDFESDLFGVSSVPYYPIHDHVLELIKIGKCTPVKSGMKYKQLVLEDGINLDLFIVTRQTWAVQFTLRTGPEDFSHWIVKKRRYGGALPSNCYVKHGLVWKEGGKEPLDIRSEEDFLDFLNLGWVEPKDRRVNLPVLRTDHFEAVW